VRERRRESREGGRGEEEEEEEERNGRSWHLRAGLLSTRRTS